MQRTLLFAFIGSLLLSAHAEEYTVTEKPFHIETKLKAVFLPTRSTGISIKPEAWSDFTITSLVPQGASVKKGDTLIGIETKDIDRHITEAEKSQASAALNLAQAKHELAQLEISTPLSLETHARNEKQTAEDLKWYSEIGHPKDIEVAKRSVKASEFRLEYQNEELKQLLKMYGEDSKTEETEEIILKRTRNYVEQAEFALKTAKIAAAHELETAIPRKLKSIQLAAADARIANADAKVKLPRALELKRLAVAKAERDDKKSTENLAKVKTDRAMMSIAAPADGVIYYGSMDEGRWNPASAVKALKIGGKLPANTTLMTFIEKGTPLELSAFASEASLSALSKGSSGHCNSHLNRYHNFPVTILSLANYPETDGTYQVKLKPELPKGANIVPSMKASVSIHSQKQDKSLTVPTDYLTRQPNGSYTVKLKLANGKTENRKVNISTSNKTDAVISDGLEKGQVIIK